MDDFSFQIQSSRSQGRYLIASSSLSQSECVLTSRSFAFGIFDSYRKRLCAQCLKSAESTHPHRCSHCDSFYYCSLACRDAHQGPLDHPLHHSLICSLLRKLATFKCPQHEKSVLKLVTMVLYQRQLDSNGWTRNEMTDLERFVDLDLETSQEDSSLELTMDEDSVSQMDTPKRPTWTDAIALQSHFHEWTISDQKDWKKSQKFIIPLLVSASLLDKSDSDEKHVEELMHWVSRIESNGFGLWSSGKNITCMGRALFPLASYFNHSCDPNCTCEQSGDVLKVFTNCDIHAGIFLGQRLTCIGEELTISYIDTNLPFQARQAKLSEDYFFKCGCTRCTLEERAGKTGKLTYPQSSAKKPKPKMKKIKEARGQEQQTIVQDEDNL